MCPFGLLFLCCWLSVFWLWQDMSRQPPTQELVAKDLHGNEWRFRHIFRGDYLMDFCSYLTTVSYDLEYVCHMPFDLVWWILKGTGKSYVSTATDSIFKLVVYWYVVERGVNLNWTISCSGYCLLLLLLCSFFSFKMIVWCWLVSFLVG